MHELINAAPSVPKQYQKKANKKNPTLQETLSKWKPSSNIPLKNSVSIEHKANPSITT